MKIDDYKFGRIVIDGKAYDNDVIIHPDGVEGGWWRQSGHNLVPEDLAGVISRGPSLLIIGTGHNGRMNVSKETIEHLTAHGIETKVGKTTEAVKLFNELSQKDNVAAALHLTC